MKITNTHLIGILLGSGIQANLLVDSLFVIGKLIKQNGKMLYTEKYIKEISTADKDIGELILILKKTGKTSYQDTKNLINMIRSKAPGYKLEFSISSDSKDHNDKMLSHLNAQFKDSKINTHVLDNVGVDISGEGRYYKKDLESDLDKILGKQ